MAKKSTKKAAKKAAPTAAKKATKKAATRAAAPTAKKAAKKAAAPPNTPTRKAAKKATAPSIPPQCIVSRSDIAVLVTAAIRARAVANSAPAENLFRLDTGDETLRLGAELNISATQRSGLATTYTAISRTGHPCGLIVSPPHARAADTISAAITLIHARSQGIS